MSNVAQIITETILEKMKQAEESGETFYWVKPFSENAPKRPYSYDTEKAYTGVNRLLLDNTEFLTFNMVQNLNKKKDSPQYQIRKGAKSHIVCYYNTVPILDDNGKPKIDEATGEELKKGFLKYYRVFSREDVCNRENGENLPSKFQLKHYTHEEMTERMKETLDRFNRLFRYFCSKNSIDIEVIKDGTEAYFCHDMTIRVPDISNFKSLYQWVHTLAHEMAHSTGVFLGRFNNMEITDIETAMQSRSREELIADICAEMVCAELGVEDDSDTPNNTVAYIQSWSEYLKDKPNEIISAATKSEQACNFILEHLRKMELEEQRLTKNNEEKESEER